MMSRAIIKLFTCIFLFYFTPAAYAIEIEISYSDNRPLFPPALWIHLEGGIQAGDTERLSAAMQPYMHREINEAIITFNSEGGSLAEGIELGRFIAQMPFVTLGQVGGSDQSNGICASACVMAYLGADYRYLHGNSRIGVHRFSAPDSVLDSSATMAITQQVSSDVMAHIREMRADPELFQLMASIDSTEIMWVPLAELKRLDVVTDDIYSENLEYRNINGKIALQIEQISRYGSNSLFLFCGDQGLVGIADLNKPEESPPLSGVSLSIFDRLFELDDWQVFEESQWRLRIMFPIPSHVGSFIAAAGSLGIQVNQPLGTFFGFSGEPSDIKISEIASSCGELPAQTLPTTELSYNTDIKGGDLTVDGFRPTTLAQCESICRSIQNCVAYSYVLNLNWCWPKSTSSPTEFNNGVVSARVR